MSYTSQALIEDYLKRTLTANEVDFLAVLLPAIGTWIDTRLSSHFDSAEPSTRLYDGGVRNLDIDPCKSITAVQHVDSEGDVVTTYEVSDYVAEPINETIKRELRARFGRWPSGIAGIKVSATFTEYTDAVPTDIQVLATRLAGQIITTGGIATGIKRESIEGHSIEWGMESIADNDRIIMSILTNRKQLLVD